MSEACDLAVVGASFAGLTVARHAAERGLDVRVIERKAEAGAPLHTTGILVEEAAALLAAPPALLCAVPGVRLYAPSLAHVDLHSPGYNFYATDTPALLRWMADEAARAGARFDWGTEVERIERTRHGVRIDPPGIEAAWLVGADGAKSTVAAQTGLGRNRRFLAGIEAEYRGIGGIDPRFLHTFLDRALAPGYIGWVVPGPVVIQVGIAGKRAERPQFRGFLEKIGRRFDFSGAEIVERRSGLIPVGGVVRPAGERLMLVGDAAGMVSPLTAGGIFTALHHGARAADAIAAHLRAGGPDPARIVPRAYPRFRVKAWLRRALDLGPPDWLMNALIGTAPMQALARLVYFHSRGLASRAAWKDLARLRR